MANVFREDTLRRNEKIGRIGRIFPAPGASSLSDRLVRIRNRKLDHPLIEHCVSDLDEASDVGTIDVVYGAVFSTELSIPPYGLPKWITLPYQDEPLYDNLRLIGFWDYGTADLRGPLPGESDKKDIAGAGIGLRLRLYDKINFQFEYARPLAEDPSDGSRSVLYYGIQMDVI